MSYRNRQAGFTLVEILIVVVILGILAAVVIPQFTQASESAKASSLVSQLQTIRSQLQLYQIQHGGEYPSLQELSDGVDDPWDVMVESHSWDGTHDFTEDDLGPYLQQPPRNPFNNSFSVGSFDSSAGTNNANADDGWAYDESNGEIRAVVTSDQQDDHDLTDSDVVVAGGGT